MNMIDQIKILKENSVYRMGDIILEKGQNRLEQDCHAILSDPNYKNTILYDYLTRKTKKPDWDTLKEIVINHTYKHKYDTAKPTDLVVHMRLGDIWDPEAPGNQAKRASQSSNHYKDFFVNAPFEAFPEINRIVIVTALHFGADETINRYFYNKNAASKSLEAAQDLVGQSKDAGLKVKIVSNENTDADLCFMSTARFFVAGVSQFAEKVVFRTNFCGKIHKEKAYLWKLGSWKSIDPDVIKNKIEYTKRIAAEKEESRLRKLKKRAKKSLE
tara:strand:- start:4196 stop:5011 length:816 start_codon:yes stop_codon:yes gene_type:complete